MRRIAGVCVVVVLTGLMVAVPARANHSSSTGINCPDFAYHEDAQAYFEAHPGDPEGLDGPIGPTSSGIPNVACEDLPRRPVTAPSPSPTTTTTSTTVDGGTAIISITPAPAIGQGLLDRTG